MAWHRLKNKTTGETAVVSDLATIDLNQWDAVPILANRSPAEFQTVDDTGAMQTDLVARAFATRVARFRQMDRDSLFAYFDRLEQRVADLEAKVNASPS
jgi:hypothetical protein